jgi:glycosyltransferase involved in cell wall biosynthesis
VIERATRSQPFSREPEASACCDCIGNEVKVEPIKVLYHEQPEPGPGGSRTSLLNLVRGLGDSVQATIVGNLPEEIVRQLPATCTVVPIASVWPPRSKPLLGRIGKTLRWWYYFLTTAARLAALVRRSGCQIVHGNNDVTSNAPAVLAARLTGRPCVCHLRGTERPWRETPWLFRRVDHCIAICQHVRDYFARKGLLDGKAVSVIYNSIDVAALEQRSHRDRRAAGTRFRAGWFGRMAWDKGLEHFVSVARETALRSPDVEFVIHGPVPEPPEPCWVTYQGIARMREELGLQNVVRFAGAYSDVAEVMRDADVALCTSPGDNFGRILFEAMACGVPVVAFDAGGTHEVLEPEANGLLVPNKDARAMAEAVLRLKGDDALRSRLIAGGRQTARQLFDARRNAESVLGIYRQLLAARAEREGVRSLTSQGSGSPPPAGSVGS